MPTDKKKGTDKIEGVGSTRGAKSIEGTQAVGEVKGVKGAQAVGRVSATSGTALGGIRGGVTAAQRARLMLLVEEETKRIYQESNLPKEQGEVVLQAIQMAIDSAIVDDIPEGAETGKEKDKE